MWAIVVAEVHGLVVEFVVAAGLDDGFLDDGFLDDSFLDDDFVRGKKSRGALGHTYRRTGDCNVG